MIIEKYETGPIDCCTYIVGCEKTKKAAIIDPGGSVHIIQKAFERNGLCPEIILCTHAHFDHTGGIAELKKIYDIPVCISKADEDLYMDMERQARMFGCKTVQAPPPDRFIKEGDAIEIGDVELLVIETPGHTPGGLCFLAGDSLFSGDTLFAASIGRTDLPGGSFRDIIDSIKGKLRILQPSVKVYPGHGESTSIGEEIRRNPYIQ